MLLLVKFFFWAVVIGHVFFALGQWFAWPRVCKKLTDFSDETIEHTAFLGRSIASYNAAIAVGLLMSLSLPEELQSSVQAVVMALISATALVGWMGTKGNSILYVRFLPAFIAMVLLVLAGS